MNTNKPPLLRKRRIILSYDSWLIKTYCLIRFLIIRINILERIERPMRGFKRGRVLDIGCGFGLFAIYNAARHPGLRFSGFELNPTRVEMARRTASRLGVNNVEFSVHDARRYRPSSDQRFVCVYMLDLLHHVPVITKYRLLQRIAGLLEEDGLLVIKDINTTPRYKLWFTWLLDRLMAPHDTLTYQSSERLIELLERCGFEATREHIRDIMPYPHVLLVCRKRSTSAAGHDVA